MFKPSEKQIDLVRVMLDPEVKPTITAFCQEIGIDRKTYYNWFDNEEFVEWFNREWDLAMAKQVSWLDRVGLMKSPKDFRYWEAMQMKYGKYARKQEFNGSMAVDDKKLNDILEKYNVIKRLNDSGEEDTDKGVVTEGS